MLAAGLGLKPRAILESLRDVRLVLAVLVLNFVAAPVFALVLTIVIPLVGLAAAGYLLGGSREEMRSARERTATEYDACFC
jgi:predicted Na+-dependent transporter